MENAKLQTNNVLEKKKTGPIDAKGQSTNIKSENCICFKQNENACLPTNEFAFILILNQLELLSLTTFISLT